MMKLEQLGRRCWLGKVVVAGIVSVLISKSIRAGGRSAPCHSGSPGGCLFVALGSVILLWRNSFEAWPCRVLRVNQLSIAASEARAAPRAGKPLSFSLVREGCVVKRSGVPAVPQGTGQVPGKGRRNAAGGTGPSKCPG